MDTVKWKIEGMTCSHCALTISNYLQKEGLKNVRVNPIDGQVSFDVDGQPLQESKISNGIHALGYKVISTETKSSEKKEINPHLKRVLICLPFTLVLMLHMIPGLHLHWLMNPWVQLILCLPVYFIGMKFFGRSALQSLRNGMPNMNVLIALGATAAFVYSLAGVLLHLGEGYLFF